MFEQLEMAPPDAILGLTEAFKKDPKPNKINLGVGVYKDAQGGTPVLECVKQAEQRLLEDEKSKSYLPIPGAPEYGIEVRTLLFGAAHELVAGGAAVTAHTPGGTGALRVAADFIKRCNPAARVWLSDPTWENHAAVFNAAGIETKAYPYYDQSGKRLAFDAMTDALSRVPEGDVVLLHACCHNPSGMDLDAEQWREVARLAGQRHFLPLVDFAYQGLAEGLEEDAAGVRALYRAGFEMVVCSSFSKNFGLYNERVGALTIVGGDATAAEKAFSHIKRCIRTNYSNPPAHGGQIVLTVLRNPELRGLWAREVAAMRDRINGMRALFVKTLKAKGIKEDFSFITRQRGMFSFSGLSREQVALLRDEYAIYIVGSGRINVAGMTEGNMDRLCEAIASVL
ncbi:MAG TPA: amino acid aminotransferase [Candidatus Hydrogenedentes bacterium]|nr:amino acid aminotransferase [Candidatus Hydrogenedentota bacterium]HNT87816.1 amino acid aminotransferase [Candidatus Hydrogenedentota bacterium]